MNNQSSKDTNLSYSDLLFELSMSFINPNVEDMDTQITETLGKMGLYVNADRAYIFDYNHELKTTTNTYEWCASNIEPQIQNLQNIPLVIVSDWVETHKKGEIVFIENSYNLPSSNIKDSLLAQDIKSMVAVPMISGGNCLGFVGFDYVQDFKIFNIKETRLLILLSKLMVNYQDKLKSEKALSDSEQHFRTLANGGEALILTSSTDKLCDYFNEPWLNFTGKTLEQELGNGWSEGVHPEDFDYCLDIYTSNFDKQTPFVMEYRLKDYTGQYRWILDMGNPRYDSQGKFLGYIGYCYDITDRKEYEQELTNKTQELLELNSKLKLLSTVFTESCEGIVITDARGICIDANESFCNLSGYTKEEIVGKNPKLLTAGHHNKAFFEIMWSDLKEIGHWQGEIWNRRKNGNVYIVYLSISAVKDEFGDISHYVGMFHDITTQKEYQKHLEYMANYDALTSLPNRNLLIDRLQQAMVQAQRHQSLLAVIFIDLDGFKFINDTYGHDYGDRLLVTISQRLKSSLREIDTVARLGGDEFVILLSDLTYKDSAIHTLDKILEVISEDIIDNSNKLHLSASLGISFYPQENIIDYEELLRQADMAMYRAKLDGKNRYKFYSL